MNFHRQKGMYYHTPSQDCTCKPYIAAFDVDWTITFSQRHLYPKDTDDIFLIPNRLEKLQEFYDKGFNIVFVSNQLCKSNKEINKRVSRMQTLIELLPFPCYLFIATDDDEYRKPKIGIWTKVQELLSVTKTAFYCGDAAGRPQDFSDSDKLFARNAGIKFYIPEKVFGEISISVQSGPQTDNSKNMIVMVGMPGSGKSHMSKRISQCCGHIIINQDILKTKNKVMKATQEILHQGKNLIVDSTNPTLKGRNEFFNLAKQYSYSIIVIYLIKDGRGWNKLRERKVPDIVYHIYFKNLKAPTVENTPGDVYRVG
jgi:bifunctional polynucleotide phosphatase/kinase